MRGLKLIQNGVVTYAPYNESTIAFYEERNRLLRGIGSSKVVEETVTVLHATQAEIEAHLVAKVVPSTAGIPVIPNPQAADVSQFMAALLQQQNEIAELKALLSSKATEQPQPEVKKKAKAATEDDKLTAELLQDI